MKKTMNLIAVLFLMACLLLTACAPVDLSGTSVPSSMTTSSTPSSGVVQGGLEDNTFFDDDTPSSGTSQPSTGTSVPGSSAPSTQTSQPATSTTKPATQSTTNPATQTTKPSAKPEESMTYEQFQAMTGAEQRAFQDSFESLDAFFAWYNAAKEAYEKENPSIEIGGNDEVVLPTG